MVAVGGLALGAAIVALIFVASKRIDITKMGSTVDGASDVYLTLSGLGSHDVDASSSHCSSSNDCGHGGH